jgi:hypothetical protein
LALNVATLGIAKFKDSLYQDIALGFREEPSLRLYSVVFAFMPALALGFTSGLLSSQIIRERSWVFGNVG